MKKIIFLLPVLMLCSCNRVQTYTVGVDANCTGLEENSTDVVFCSDASGNPINGIVKQYYETGKIWREMTIKNGRENGVEREYYENGNLHVVANVKDGQTNGISKLYNEDGKLYMELNLSDGEVVDAKVYDDNGVVVQTSKNM